MIPAFANISCFPDIFSLSLPIYIYIYMYSHLSVYRERERAIFKSTASLEKDSTCGKVKYELCLADSLVSAGVVTKRWWKLLAKPPSFACLVHSQRQTTLSRVY